MTIKPVEQMVAEANAEIDSWSPGEAKKRLQDPAVTFVDIRDVRELWREGTIPGAMHAPRGMLEFWVDPASPYAKDAFQQDKTFVLFCASGWRSALATKALRDMGLPKVAHVAGGFSEWKKSDYPVEERAQRSS
ncbi:MAG: rhodanese-like domain-containing protein [Pseudomonadota bacterium]